MHYNSYNHIIKILKILLLITRIIDRLFNLMNARNSFGYGFKSHMKLNNQFVWKVVFESANSYSLQLKCEQKNSLQHRRKTFSLGFLINIMSTDI